MSRTGEVALNGSSRRQSPPRFYAFWAINAEPERRELYAQLERMRSFRLDGVVWHPRFYPATPAYLGDAHLAIVSDVVLRAKSLGLDFWIYDENGWPSGTVGGAMLAHHPGVRRQWAGLTAAPPADAADRIARFDRGGRTWHVVRRLGPGVDYLDPALATCFIEMTYDRYARGLTPEAFAHVSTFFSDEPEFGLGPAYEALSPDGAVPWTPRLAARFRERHGRDLEPPPPSLFFGSGGGGDGGDEPAAAEARVQFWELLTDLLCEAFVASTDAWCRGHGNRFAAHAKGEKHPLFQVPMVGSNGRVLRHLSLPAIDALERGPSSDYFPRQAATVARHFGDGRCMAECFGGTGWSATPANLVRYVRWLGGNGVTDFVMRLWQYRLDSRAIQDWPASIPPHVGWRDAFADVLDHARKAVAESPVGADVGDGGVLLISPHRGVMAAYGPAELRHMNVHNAAAYADTPAGQINDAFLAAVASLQSRGTPFHVTDERTFEEGTLDRGGGGGQGAAARLRVGRVGYGRVVLTPGCRLSVRGEGLVESLRAAGVAVERYAGGEAEPSRGREAKHGDAADREARPLSWVVPAGQANDLFLEPRRVARDAYEATFACDAAIDGLELVFADDVAGVRFGGVAVPVERTAEGSFTGVASSAAPGDHVVAFRGDAPVRPFAWVRGRFLVVRAGGACGFVPGPNGTVRADGPFLIAAPQPWVSRDLTAGFPFAPQPVEAHAEIDVPPGASTIRLSGVVADAGEVLVDGESHGFAWCPSGGSTWDVPLPAGREAGRHRLTLRLCRSAFNAFGPHHHFEGDCHVVSSDQFIGKKNFADRADAPAFTHVPQWHLRPLCLPGSASIF